MLELYIEVEKQKNGLTQGQFYEAVLNTIGITDDSVYYLKSDIARVLGYFDKVITDKTSLRQLRKLIPEGRAKYIVRMLLAVKPFSGVIPPMDLAKNEDEATFIKEWLIKHRRK